MTGYSLQSSLEKQRRKKTPTLDGIAPRRGVAVSYRPVVNVSRAVAPSPPRRRLDALHAEHRSFLHSLQELSLADSCIRFWRKWQLHSRRLRRFSAIFLPEWAPHKMLYGSIVGGIAFGMVSMAFIEHSFGPGVFARSGVSVVATNTGRVAQGNSSPALSGEGYDPEQDVFFEYFGEETKEQYEENISDMVKGYPIESMLPYIFAQDRLTAAFLVGIARKESNWGRRIPVLDGQDCFNYWGYRGVRRMMGSGGHTCFNSEKDAVDTVAKRLETLIHSEKLNTPEKMIVWKCGFSCQGHSRESVKKWISDVDIYFSQLSGK